MFFQDDSLGGELPSKKVGMFVRNYELIPWKETNLVMARALFNPNTYHLKLCDLTKSHL